MHSQPPVRRGGERGFTLVELLIVVVVLGILSGIVAFGVARFRSDATAAACRADVTIVTRAAVAYEAVTGNWPSAVDVLVDGEYLKAAPGGTYRFDGTARTVSRDPACAGSGTVATGASGAVTGTGGKCVDVAGSSPADGTAVQLLTCNGSTGQLWTVPASWPGPVLTLGRCLAAAGGGTGNRTAVQLATCDGSAGQQWNLDSGLLRHPRSGRCLDAEGGSTADRTRLIIFDCHGGANQRWVFP